MSTVAALAGRRVDPLQADQARFPSGCVEKVRSRISEAFEKHHISSIVCSAACGVDLIALNIAIERRMHVRIVLPFSAKRFEETSVIDRPGNWKKSYDRALSYASQTNGLLILEGGSDEQKAYNIVTLRLFEILRASKEEKIAIAVWDGECKNSDDATCDFISQAKNAAIPVISLSTLD